ncbi:nucleotidyltransferase family protein [Mesorhizobium sp. CA14]|uniref:nucleotidyltransferase family protein n=1 Tax=Mesorhizobium sp. CA14 TaxID=2876642 RepID=UPI001CD02957|nr:nucleotidyltransferase family protein [Mesorhizobium sp. CA14]MBZ9849680.1 nucleotidyltransferase family protein [Mesorhizobium sp. CA14]
MVAFSEAVAFAALLTECPALESRPSDAIQAGFHAHFAEMSWQVMPSYITRLVDWIGPSGSSDGPLLAARAEAFRIFFGIQERVLVEVAEGLRGARLEHCLLKGTASRLNLYPSPDLRGGIDLDFAIPANAAHEGRRIAREMGFEQSAWDERARTFVKATPEQREWIDANHYELGFLIRRHTVDGLSADQAAAIRRQLHLQPNPWHEMPDQGLGVWINLDLHTGLSHDIPVEPLLRDARIHRHCGVDLPVPPPAWQLFHTIYKLYWEGVFSYGKGIYQYADICRLAPRMDADDVDEFVHLLGYWRLEAAARHVLCHLPTAFGVVLPSGLDEFMAFSDRPAPGIKPQEENNFGSVWRKLWGYR